MKFERAKNNHRTATFEVDPITNFHEQLVATNALGTLTTSQRTKRELYLPSALLGVKLGRLPYIDEQKEDRPLIPSSAPLTRKEAAVLGTALKVFIEDTPQALTGLLNMGNPSGSNFRVVEGEKAVAMLETLHEEFDGITIEPTAPYGFR